MFGLLFIIRIQYLFIRIFFNGLQDCREIVKHSEQKWLLLQVSYSGDGIFVLSLFWLNSNCNAIFSARWAVSFLGYVENGIIQCDFIVSN